MCGFEVLSKIKAFGTETHDLTTTRRPDDALQFSLNEFAIVIPQYEIARNDVIGSLLQWHLWTSMGWQEVKRRYRRTVFGPFWATLSIGMFIGGMVYVWAPLFKADVSSYLPFLASGLVTWAFATAMCTEGCTVYISGANVITQLNFPYLVLNFSCMWRNVIVFFHNVVIVAIVVVALKVPVSWRDLLLFPGLLIVAVNGAWISVVLGILGTRFRDIPPLVGNLIQILVFITPIFWTPNQLGDGRHLVIELNYMYHLVEVMRAPMLGTVPSFKNYAITILGAIIGWLFTFALYARFRRRIPYWL
jgi:homopolymeric O-antigen transport system permease protein